jgi:hypothetical protein
MFDHFVVSIIYCTWSVKTHTQNYSQLYVYLFILHSVRWISFRTHADQILPKLPSTQKMLIRHVFTPTFTKRTQIPVPRFLGRQHFVRWHLILPYTQHGTCVMSPILRLEFWDGCLISAKKNRHHFLSLYKLQNVLLYSTGTASTSQVRTAAVISTGFTKVGAP